VKFLLVEDHPLMRKALREVVESLGDNVAAVEAGTPNEAQAALAAHGSFDAVLLDLKLGEGDGFAVLKELRARWPQIPVMVVTGSTEGRDLIRSIDLGAMAFVNKRSGGGEILAALSTIMTGGIYLPPDTMALLDSARAAEAAQASAMPVMADVLPGASNGSFGVQAPSPQIIARLGLTPRQTDVLLLLLHGKPNKLIARELNLSVETIKDHVAAVLRSLNVSSRTQAVLAVTQLSSHSHSSRMHRGLQ
jgi:DNA-binding NarL/FixJ family response regulator